MTSRNRASRVLVALALTLGTSAGALAASQHAHDSHSHGALTLELRHGQKWATDEPLRHGMSSIRAAFAASLPRIHEGQFTPSDYARLADYVQEQIDYVVGNCRLPEDADLQLHIALEAILTGVQAMKDESGQDQGAVAIVNALNAYGEHFDHPGWQPLGH